MDEWKVIGLLVLAILASGCGENQKQGIAVSELGVQPQSIRAGSTVSVNLEAVNAGLLKGTVDIGSKRTGSNVLTNHCPDVFDIKEFRGSSSRTSANQNEYVLGQGERIRLFWRLKQTDKTEIPLQGYTCNLKFEIPFNYSVRAYKQVQVKKSRSVSGSEKLATDISPGPLSIQMKIVGSTAQQSNTILKQDNPQLYLTAANRDTDESPYQGLIKINDIEIKGSGIVNLKGPEGGECGRKSVSLASGKQKIYRCDINFRDFSAPSARGEIESTINYTFVKDLGERSVKVKYNG